MIKNQGDRKTQIIAKRELDQGQSHFTYYQSTKRTLQVIESQIEQYKKYFSLTQIKLDQIADKLRMKRIIYNKNFKYKRDPEFSLTIEPFQKDFSFVMINVTMGAFSTTLKLHFYQNEDTKLRQYPQKGAFSTLYHKSIQQQQYLQLQYMEKTFNLEQHLTIGIISKQLRRIKALTVSLKQKKGEIKQLQENLKDCYEKIKQMVRINFMVIVKEYFFNKIAYALGVGPKLLKMFGKYDIIFKNKTAVFALKKYQKLSSKSFRNNLVKLKQKVKLLHHLHIVHRDLKPDNLLVQKGQIYIIDYGATEIIKEDTTQDSNFLINTYSYQYINDHFKSFVAHRNKSGRANLYYADIYALTLIEKINWQVTTQITQPNILLKSYNKYIKKRQQIYLNLYTNLEIGFVDKYLRNSLEELIYLYKQFKLENEQIAKQNKQKAQKLSKQESEDFFFYKIENIFLANPTPINYKIYQKFVEAYRKPSKADKLNCIKQTQIDSQKGFKLSEPMPSFNLKDFYIQLPLYPIKLKFLAETNMMPSNQQYIEETLKSNINLTKKSKIMTLMSIFQFKDNTREISFNSKAKIAFHFLTQNQIELPNQADQQTLQFQTVLKTMYQILNKFELEKQDFQLNCNYLNLLSNFILINNRLQNKWALWVSKIIESVSSKKMKLLYLLRFKNLSMFGVFRQFELVNQNNRKLESILIQKSKPILNCLLEKVNKTIFYDQFEQFFIAYFKGDLVKLSKHLNCRERNQKLQRLNYLFGECKSEILYEAVQFRRLLHVTQNLDSPQKQRIQYEDCNITYNSFNYMKFFILLNKSLKGVDYIKEEITIFDEIIGCQAITKNMNLVLRFMIAIQDQASKKESQMLININDKIKSYFYIIINKFQTFQNPNFQITNGFEAELRRLVFYLFELVTDSKYQIVLRKYLAEFKSLWHIIFKFAQRYILNQNSVKTRLQLNMLQICQNFLISIVFLRLLYLCQPSIFSIFSDMNYMDDIDLFNDFQIDGKFSLIYKLNPEIIRSKSFIFELMLYKNRVVKYFKNTKLDKDTKQILKNIPRFKEQIDNFQYRMYEDIEKQINQPIPFYTLSMISIYLNHQIKQNVKNNSVSHLQKYFKFIKNCFIHLNQKDNVLDLKSMNTEMECLFQQDKTLNLELMSADMKQLLQSNIKSQVQFCKYTISRLNDLNSQIISYRFILLRMLRFCYDNKHRFQVQQITKLQMKIVSIFDKANPLLTNLKDSIKQYKQITSDIRKQAIASIRKLVFCNKYQYCSEISNIINQITNNQVKAAMKSNLKRFKQNIKPPKPL